MQLFSWLYLVASLSMVSSKMEPKNIAREGKLSPVFSHRRKSSRSQFDDKLIKDNAMTSSEESNQEDLKSSKSIIKLLQQSESWKPPLVIINKFLKKLDNSLDLTKLENQHPVERRSRYYRRYPWKRQNTRSQTTYNYGAAQVLCKPSKNRIFKILMSLHDGRQGREESRVRFCHRQRPAGTVFTNIRFIGR